jgi:hypothetical protein
MIDILLSQAALNRSNYISRIISSQNSQWQTAQVRGYDGTNGRYIVQDTAGNTVHAKSISTGFIAIGDQVPLSAQKSTPIIDAMPN